MKQKQQLKQRRNQPTEKHSSKTISSDTTKANQPSSWSHRDTVVYGGFVFMVLAVWITWGMRSWIAVLPFIVAAPFIMLDEKTKQVYAARKEETTSDHVPMSGSDMRVGASATNFFAVDNKFSLSEIRKHNTASDAWIVIRNQVYDISNWADHPGGDVVFTQAGCESTDIFTAFHPPSASKSLMQFHIGEVISEDRVLYPFNTPEESKASYMDVEFVTGYRDLIRHFKKQGLMEANLLYYAWKVFSTGAIGATAVALVLRSQSFLSQMLSAFVLALFWQQCGWLAHDFAHHQVFKNRDLNNLTCMMVANVWQGFCLAWWKDKHNFHHSIPNVHESVDERHDGDPDIDTMPLLAWSKQMLSKLPVDGKGRFMVRYQAFLYFPILFLARLSWAKSSVEVALRGAKGLSDKGTWHNPTHGSDYLVRRMGTLEGVGLLVHYSWYFWLISIVYSDNGFVAAFLFLFLSQTMSGLLLAVVFGLGHNGMDMHDHGGRPDFWTLQCTTTRNVTNDRLGFVGWFTGGLHLQVEHHLVPQMPRHNLARAQPIVQAFCEKHGVPYKCENMWVGTVEILSHLQEVTQTMIAEFPAM